MKKSLCVVLIIYGIGSLYNFYYIIKLKREFIAELILLILALILLVLNTFFSSFVRVYYFIFSMMIVYFNINEILKLTNYNNNQSQDLQFDKFFFASQFFRVLSISLLIKNSIILSVIPILVYLIFVFAYLKIEPDNSDFANILITALLLIVLICYDSYITKNIFYENSEQHS